MIVSLAVEGGQQLGDLLSVAEHHPDVIETLGAYLRWRNERTRAAHG